MAFKILKKISKGIVKIAIEKEERNHKICERSRLFANHYPGHRKIFILKASLL